MAGGNGEILSQPGRLTNVWGHTFNVLMRFHSHHRVSLALCPWPDGCLRVHFARLGLPSLVSLEKATYAVVAEALAEGGKWEWCLVLLEELEQQLKADGAMGAAVASTTTTRSGASGQNSDEVNDEENDENMIVLDMALDKDGRAAAASAPQQRDDVLAAYTATIRACGRGRSGHRPVLAVLERMVWEGIVPDERAFIATIQAIRACGSGEDGLGASVDSDESAEIKQAGPISVGEAARALIDWDAERSNGAARPLLYRCNFTGG